MFIKHIHFVSEFFLLRFYICNYTTRDFILNEPKIEVGKEKQKLFVVGVL